MDEIIINMEGRHKECAFFALYAGLRMYSEKKADQHRRKETMSIAGAEAYGMLQDLKEAYPKEFGEAQEEYNEVIITSPIKGITISKND